MVLVENIKVWKNTYFLAYYFDSMYLIFAIAKILPYLNNRKTLQ